MFESILSVQHGLIMESSDNVTNYDVQCAKLLVENSMGNPDDYKVLVPVINNVSDKYIKKIDDAFAVLSDIAVDADQMAEFFTKIQHTEELDEIPLSTPLKNVNEIGRLKPEYLTQIAKSAASEINNIVNSKVSMRDLMTTFTPDMTSKIKRQLVVSTKPVTDIKGYIKSQERPNIVPMDSQAIMTLCIPFLRSFPVKKRELQEEIAAVKVAINTSVGLMRSYTDTAVALKDKGQISGEVVNTLNYYLFNQNRLMDELITYLVFTLITKIDTYTFNVNSYMELYRKVLKYNPEGSNVYHESVFEYSLAAADIDTTVNHIIHGDASSLIDWSRRTYDKAKSTYENSRSAKQTSIDFIMDQYNDDNYPYGDLFDTLDKIESGLERIVVAVKDQYASPEAIMNAAGIGESLTARFSMMISEINNISRYFDALNAGKSKTDVLFSILAEMRASEKNMIELGEEIKDVYDEIEETIKYLENNMDNVIPNELVRMEMIKLVNDFEKDYRNFLGVVIQNIIQRGKSLEDEVLVLVENMDEVIDVTDNVPSGSSYNILAVEACIEMDEVFSRLFIEGEMIKFRNAKFAKEYGLVLEAEEPAKPNQTTDPNKKEGASPELTEDTSKQSDADKQQNAEAAQEAKNEDKKEDPEKKKKLSERIKELIDKINGYFNKILPDFIKGITAQLQNNTDFLKNYKDPILNRSYNGLTLNIYNYFNLKSQTILDDIGKVSAFVSQISIKDLAEYAKPEVIQEKMFGFLKVPSDMTLDDYIRLYYKVGANQKEVKKIAISNSELKAKTIEMIDFCEDYYLNNGYKNVENDVSSLKNSVTSKINSLKNEELTDEQSKALQAISREVLVFTGAVLTAFRNRAQHYMFAIRALLPKNVKPVEDETPKEEGTGENPEPATT